MSLARFSVKNSVLANILMVVITTVGAYSLLTMPQEMVPDLSFPWLFITVIDPGVSPEEMEKLVAKPIEDEISDVDGIDNVTSISREGGAFVWIKFETMPEDEFDKRLQEIRTEIDRVKLPDTAEEPNIEQFKTQDFLPLVSVVLSGELPKREMKRLAEDLREDILDIPKVSRVAISGVREREIWVEVDPDKLARYRLSTMEIIAALKNKNLNLAGGEVKIGRWDYSVRTVGEINRVQELEDVIIRADERGNHVRVRDLAQVRDTFKDDETISRFNGKPSVTLTVAKKQDGNSIDIIEDIKRLVEDYHANRLPAGATITLTNDSSVYIVDILDKLKSNAWMGMILVALSLWLLLGSRQALFAVLGIPIALAGTFIIMKVTGNSINGSSLFALVLVLGMLVDDAIVVIENCYRYVQQGYSPAQAAVIGTREVTWPILASAGTTIAAFLPLMLLPGIIGDFMQIVPIVVTLALVSSLFEAFTILPAHISEWSKRPNNNQSRDGRWGKGRVLRDKPLVDFSPVRKRYTRVLGKVLRRRYLVVALVTFVMIASLPIALTLGVDMFADEEIPQFFVLVTMPEGTRLAVTDQVVLQLEAIAQQLPKHELKSVVANTGIQQTPGEWFFKPSVGQLIVELVDRKKRQREVDDIIDEMRSKATKIPGMQALAFEKIQSGPPTGAPIEVKVKGKRLDELQQVNNEVKAALRGIDGVYDIRDDFITGARELRISVDEERASLFGLSVMQVAGAVYNAFHGTVATTFRDGDDEIDVRVRHREDARRHLADLANFKVATPMRDVVLLKDVARLHETSTLAAIKHDDRERAITITANVDNRKTTSIAANQRLKAAWADIARRFPGYSLKFGGEFSEFNEAFKNLGLLFALGIAIMFTIMASQFSSFVQPAIIFMAVIFAFWGAVMGLFVIGSPFTINNLFGLVALAGVSVNNSIVLVEFINIARANGESRWRSILGAAKLRIRPILLTSVTTVLGLAPMAIGLGGYSEVWGPLATVMVWGLTASSVLSLFLIPCLYAIVGDAKRLFVGRRYMDEHGRLAHWEEKRQLQQELARLDRLSVRRSQQSAGLEAIE